MPQASGPVQVGSVRSREQTALRGGGRPRDAVRDQAILDAAFALLLELGYDQLSIEAVAARAGVGKTTIYRRYRDKAALVAAVVERCGPEEPPATSDDDDLREALLRTVRWLARGIGGQQLGLLTATFAAMRQSPDLAAEIRRILRRDEAAMTAPLFGAAAAHGEKLTPGAATLFAEVAPAVILHHLTMVGPPCDEEFLAHLVDDILMPLVVER